MAHRSNRGSKRGKEFVLAGSLEELKAKGRLVLRGSHRPILVIYDYGRSDISQPFRHAAASTFAVWPDERPSFAAVSVNLMERGVATLLRDRDMLGRLAVSFLLATAAPLNALAQEERPVPPLPIPDVAPTAGHIPHVAPTATHSRSRLVPPLPQPRPASMSPTAAAAPIAPEKTLVQIND
jgi:hypothetical protein